MNRKPPGILCFLAILFANPHVFAAHEDAPVHFEVEVVRDIAYRHLRAGEDPQKPKNKLDLYLPKGQKGFPVLFFVHGIAWQAGDKDYFGLYSDFATFLAKNGVGVVLPNYRLSPTVQHPEHIKDVACAFAWTHGHIAKYGGRANQLFVGGFSAGGHLASLLATDEHYLSTENLSQKVIRGIISVSGAYNVDVEGLKLVETVFGKDAEIRRKASPLNHVRPGLPPFLLLYADGDYRTCDTNSQQFFKVLQQHKIAAELKEIKGRTHLSILRNAIKPEDPVSRAVLEFIAKQASSAAGR